MSSLLRRLRGGGGGRGSSAPPSPAQPSKVQSVLSKWNQLNENLSAFDKLEQMRGLVVTGELQSSAYDVLHELAVERIMGQLRTIFPRDRDRWDAVFPNSPTRSAGRDEEDGEVGEDENEA